MAVKYRDYYEVLGVPRNATADQIKKEYRQLARKHHPDLKAAGERAQAAERFKEINEANEVLSDPEKRAKYDALGDRWKSGADFTPPPGAGAPFEGGTVDWDDLGGFSDFFASIFGVPPETRRGGRGRARGGRGGAIAFPGSDIEAELPITVEDLLHGGKRRIQLEGGRGLDVEIPVGSREGTKLRLAGQGEPGTGGAPSGDLYLHLRLQSSNRYRVNGDDLEMDLALWPWQAVLGAAVRLETPDGAVTLTVPPGTPNGRKLRLRARGLPSRGGARGDLYAVVRVVVPEHPSTAEREAYEALRKAAGAPADRPAEE